MIIGEGVPAALSKIHRDHGLFYQIDPNAILVWGSNEYGQSGLGHTDPIAAPTPVLVDGKSPQNIITGGGSTFLIMSNGEVLACGLNDFGQLALGHTESPITEPTPVRIKEKSPKNIITGGRSTFLFVEDRGGYEVHVCGSNSVGQLGLGDTQSPITTPKHLLMKGGVPKTIITGGNSTFFHDKKNGEVRACGLNDSGQLALGHNCPVTLPERVPFKKRPKRIITNGMNTFCLMKDGTMLGCGANNFGQLDGVIGEFGNKPFVYPASVSTASDWERALSRDTHNHILRPVPILINQMTPKNIVMGYSNFFFMMPDGMVFFCGRNQFGNSALDKKIAVFNALFPLKIEGESPEGIIVDGHDTLLFMRDSRVFSAGYENRNSHKPVFVPKLTAIMQKIMRQMNAPQFEVEPLCFSGTLRKCPLVLPFLDKVSGDIHLPKERVRVRRASPL